MQKIFFLGIGGIGMSALARYFHKRGAEIYGYDRTPSPLTNELIAEGMHIHFEDSPDWIPSDISLCIYTPAIPKTNKEYQFLEKNGIEFIKRSQVLGMLTKDKTCFAVAGTHGKTSVTATIAHILHGDRLITAFIGGISINYNSNFIDDLDSDTIIAEADEYDRSFLNLFPDIAVVTAIDPDHLDIYGSEQQLRKSFDSFVNQIKPDGFLVTKPELLSAITAPCNVKTYSLDNPQTDYYTQNLSVENEKLQFDLVMPNGIIKDVLFEKIGFHNVENAVAAAAVSDLAGINHTVIKQQLETYEGVKRRFEYIIQREDFIYIDDYAHHPQEITACIDSIRKMHPNKKVCGVFQPHLFSRTRDFSDDFARSLEQLDTVILFDIYPARELPIKGVTSEMLLKKINKMDKILLSKEQLIQYIEIIKPEILVTMGAGDIDRLVNKIKIAFEAF